ncbi:MlaA family lipoprotein [Marinobacter antarcticus]
MTHYLPRGRRLAISFAAAFIVAMSAGPTIAQTKQEPVPPVPESAAPTNSQDPYENWNRKVYRFNDTIDRWALRPVAKTYRTFVPDLIDRAITNFFNNLTEVRNFTNSVLQLKGESAIVAVGRFTYNTVLGLGGLIDVATALGLPERPEDFGQTLGYWGAGSGPYLMLPLLGPSSPRHLSGLGADVFVFPSPWNEVESPDNYYARGVQVVDKRADLIPAEGFISGDTYTFVRNAFLQRREFLINDGKVTRDPFASGDNEDLMLDDF